MNTHTTTDTLTFEQRTAYLANMKNTIQRLSFVDDTTRLVEGEHCHITNIRDCGANGYPQMWFLYPHKTQSQSVKVSRLLKMAEGFYLPGRPKRAGDPQIDRAHYRMALHKCHNGACVNPNHIYVGTAEMNNYDGLLSKDNKHLSVEDVISILVERKNFPKEKQLAQELADVFHVHISTIRAIWRNEKYRFIDRETYELHPPSCDTLKVGPDGVYKDGTTYAYGRGYLKSKQININKT